MLFQRSKHRSAIPFNLNSHQVLRASEVIHQEVLEAVTPLLESRPHYQTVVLILDKVKLAIDQLDQAQTQRKYKNARELRGVSGQDGPLAGETARQVKLDLFRVRGKQMSRLRKMVIWYFESIPPKDPELQIEPVLSPQQAAAKRIARLLHKRIDRFERSSYEESSTEFKHFINSVEADPEAVNAMSLLGVADVYASIKSLQERFNQEDVSHANQDSIGEQMPKVVDATRDLRHVVSLLLKHLHFDLETGDPSFNPVLGTIDEILDKAHAKAARRITLAKKKAASNQAANQQPATDATDASGASDANAPAAGEPPADGGTGGASGGASGDTSRGDASQDQDPNEDQSEDQVTDQNDAQTAEASSDQQQEVEAA